MRQFTSRMVLLAALSILLLVAADVFARQGTVVKRDGRRFTGEVVEDTADRVVLNIRGVRLTFERSEIASFEYLKSPEEEYRERRARLEDDDYKGRFDLANWLYSQQHYALAKQELDALIATVDSIPSLDLRDRIRVLSRAVEARLKQTGQRNGGDGENTNDGNGNQQDTGTSVGDKDFPLLDMDDVNAIRVWEIRLQRKVDGRVRLMRPRVIIPTDVIDDFFRLYKGTAQYRQHQDTPKTLDEVNKFKRRQPYDQLRVMFETRARSLYTRVRVPEDPPALAMWRESVHPRYVISYCATTDCHGSLNSDRSAKGGLYLASRRPQDVRTVYTNFYIMSKFETEGGDRALDRDRPQDSLLIQMALPRRNAVTPHPEVRGWRPRLPEPRGDEIPREQQMLMDFIGGELYLPMPPYPVELNMPWTKTEESEAEE